MVFNKFYQICFKLFLFGTELFIALPEMSILLMIESIGGSRVAGVNNLFNPFWCYGFR